MSLLPSGVVQSPGHPYFAIASSNVPQYQYSTITDTLTNTKGAYMPTNLSTIAGKNYLFNGVVAITPSTTPLLSTNSAVCYSVCGEKNGGSTSAFVQDPFLIGALGATSYVATQSGVIFNATSDNLIVQVLPQTGTFPTGANYVVQAERLSLTQLN